MDSLRKSIVAAIEARGETLRSVSLDVLGKNHAYLHQFINRGTPEKLPEDAREKLAAWMGVPESDLRVTVASQPPSNVMPAPDAPTPRSLLSRGPRVDVLGTTVGGSDGDFRFNGSRIDTVGRPAALRHAQDVYALRVSNDSMYPQFGPGDLIYVSPHHPPGIGEAVIVEMHGPSEDEPGASYIKTLVRRTADKVIVSQFNPPQELVFDRRKVKSLHRVVPVQELLPK